ncbi:transcription termination factor 2-like [Maniola jurtina]|uniref:transcription termination factor 2-like n=1 Tax=Maniola jurtina TaxID=191418 RepID=UPI001E68F9D6|nr:transcription termination factor 2-like [Maniola jurtina]
MSCVMLRRTKLQLQEKGQLTCLPERSTHDVSVTLQQEEMNVYQKVRYNSKSLCDSERLNTIMSCVMLRRTKLQLQEKGQLTCLPERSTHDVSVTLQQEEMNVYQKVRYNSKSLCDSERLNTIMSCVMLRRTKLQLQEKGQLTCLPERSTHDVSVTLQQEEMNVYQKVRYNSKSLCDSERLNTIMSCVMLRRTKLQLQEKGQLTCLPERSTHDVSVTLQQEEMNVYQKVLVFSKTLFAQFLHQRAEKASGMQGLMPPKKDSEYAKMHKKMIALQGAKPVKSHEILVLLLRLRQVCCHCGLIAAMLDHDNNTELAEDTGSEDLLAELNKLTLQDNNTSRRRSGGKQAEKEEEEPGEGTTAAEAIKSVLSSNNPVFNLQRQSSKIKAVMECLNKNIFKNKGEKAVVVSQWTSVLNLVERELKAAHIKSVTLCGDVPVATRAPLINALNDPKSDVRVMLLSLCAGGVGLNLCGANHLLLLDPHWNPQLEEQAQDRIYRVGQLKPVHIYKFMCVDTVEQSIRQLQKAKLEMAENVLTGAKNTNGKLSVEELKILFNMGS